MSKRTVFVLYKHTIILITEEFTQRISQVPDIMRGVGVIGPLADVVENLLPFIKTAYLVNTGLY